MSINKIFRQNRYNQPQLLMDGFYFSVNVEAEYNGERFPLKLFFYESYTPTREFVCIGTTDMSLSAKTVKRLYAVRWSTENYLANIKDVRTIQLTKQCQGQSIDLIYFDLVLTEILYIFLALLLNELKQPYST